MCQQKGATSFERISALFYGSELILLVVVRRKVIRPSASSTQTVRKWSKNIKKSCTRDKIHRDTGLQRRGQNCAVSRQAETSPTRKGSQLAQRAHERMIKRNPTARTKLSRMIAVEMVGEGILSACLLPPHLSANNGPTFKTRSHACYLDPLTIEVS